MILGASFDDATANKVFAEKFQFPYPLLCDTDRIVGLAYQACDDALAEHPRRITYVIDEDGVISHAIETKDPAAQADEILAML